VCGRAAERRAHQHTRHARIRPAERVDQVPSSFFFSAMNSSSDRIPWARSSFSCLICSIGSEASVSGGASGAAASLSGSCCPRLLRLAARSSGGAGSASA
jgi:hypothetical protein